MSNKIFMPLIIFVVFPLIVFITNYLESLFWMYFWTFILAAFTAIPIVVIDYKEMKRRMK